MDAGKKFDTQVVVMTNKRHNDDMTEEHFDDAEFLDLLQDFANAYLCDNAEPKEQPDYGDIESDGIF